ncbi:MAG: YerC/YecD family TrpR-related protein [Candidatus Moranbacteria bacterium]|nr:YerC/YecD family TrpR-related protein [Candidatus Moranbacteria bacterium]
MSKVRVYSIDKNERYQAVGDLFEIIVNLRTKKEVIDFLIGLFTPSEMLMIARRIQIAGMLLEDDNYEIIRKKLKVSNQTISKVEYWLKSDEQKNKIIVTKLNQIKKSSKGKLNRSVLDKFAHHRALKELIS